MEITAYHGTFWERGSEFLSPSSSFNDLAAVFVSNSKEVARTFSRYHDPDENSLFVVMKCHVILSSPFVYDPQSASGLWIRISGDGGEYHISNDREDLFAALRNAGYDAFIVKNNYPDGDDIACFYDSSISVNSYSLSTDGNIWTKWLDWERAIEIADGIKSKPGTGPAGATR